jgi:hypothetical protein
MMTDEREDKRAGGTEFELSVSQLVSDFTPVDEVAEKLAEQVKLLFKTAFKGAKTVSGRVAIKLTS